MSGDSKALPPETQKWLPYLLLVVAVFAAYGNVYDNVLLFDDNLVITLNEFLKSWDTFSRLFTASTTEGAHISGGFYRPLQNILFFFIYQITGAEPPLYHLLNVSLHAANAGLVFCLGRKLGFNPWAAFLAALIWSLHPLHTEVIAYASGMPDPLFTLFCLLGVIVLLPDFTPRRFLMAMPIFILGLLSKEAAVVFPALVVSCIFLCSAKRLNPRTYLRTWPLWLMAGAYTYWRMTAPGFDGPQSYDKLYDQHDFANLKLYADHFSYRFYTFLATLPGYLKLLVWPTGLHMERTFPVYVSLRPIETWEGIGICAVAAGQIIRTCLYPMSSLRRPPPLLHSNGGGRRSDARREMALINSGNAISWGVLWFGAAHFPNTGLIFPMNSQFLEHWMYLPSIGLFLGVAETLSSFLKEGRWQKAKPVATCGAVAVAAILGLHTFEQNEVWHDPFVFYANIFKYGEPSARAHNNLALAYMEKEDYPAAITEFQKAIDLTDTYPETRHNLALALLKLPDAEQRIPEAIADLDRALELDPNFYRSWDALAQIYTHTGNHGKEAECRKRAEDILKSGNR